MNNAIKIQEVANAHAFSMKFTKATIWNKSGNRLYINGFGYNTKKCKQSVYIDLDTFEIKCYTECPGQDYNWIKSQNAKVTGNIRLRALARLLRIVDNCK